jgi:hypothetical protein
VLSVVDGYFTRTSCECVDFLDIVYQAGTGVACVSTKSRSEETNWYALPKALSD